MQLNSDTTQFATKTGSTGLDPLGFYKLVHNARVNDTASTAGAKIAVLEVGTKVQIVEVRVMEERMRGRILEPEGWISMRNLENEKRFVEKMEDEELCADPDLVGFHRLVSRARVIDTPALDGSEVATL